MKSDANSERFKKIRLVLFDVDGVLTRGDIVYASPNSKDTAEALESKAFSVRDGAATRWALEEGLRVGFVTGRESRVVERRAKDLGVELLWQGAKDKGAAFDEAIQKAGVLPEQTSYMGDDIMDLAALRRAGLACCPADAHEEVKARCHFVSRFRGGEGAARELLEEILKAQHRWESILQRSGMGR